MSIIVHIPTGLTTPELEILLAKAQKAIDEGKQTTVVTCAGGPGYACSWNIYGLRPICTVCKSRCQRGLSRLRGKFEHIETPVQIEIPNRTSERNDLLKNRWRIKKHLFEGADVGQAAYASYIGLSRDQDLEGHLASWSLNKLVATSEQLVRWFRELLRRENPEKVVTYNGRLNQYRPLVRVAQQEKIPIEVMEFSGQESDCVYTFRDELPQHMDLLQWTIETAWKNFKGDLEKSAFEYFTFKSAGAVTNDRSYVQGQNKDLMPDGWDSTKHNVAIFNSSEDEFAAFGGEYDETIYRNQTEAFSRLCSSLKNDKDIMLWLRIHPNLASVQWSFAQKLLQLESHHSNVRVIAPDSPVSTYRLLEACDTAVTSGGTMAVEAAYWGKPSILVGRAVYERLGSCYFPRTHEEVVALVRDRNLKPLPKEGALKVAIYFMKGGTSIPYFGGNRKRGFDFDGKHILKTTFETICYNLSKGFEKYVLGNWVNYKFGTTSEKLREIPKDALSDH
jgi:hypothetical protein